MIKALKQSQCITFLLKRTPLRILGCESSLHSNFLVHEMTAKTPAQRQSKLPKMVNKKHEFEDKSKPCAIRSSNIIAAKGMICFLPDISSAVSDAIRTSLGPRGMDKMIQEAKGDVTITNDGATILKQMKLLHPAAKMLVELSKAQDIEAGDGTTTVVVLAGSLLDASSKLLSKGIHPTIISEAFQRASTKACDIIKQISMPIDVNDRELLCKIASTSLNS
ncbi:unnamed protein product, partial [Protopolystoma xenopodis]